MHHHGWIVFFGVVTLGIVIALTHGNRQNPQPFQVAPVRLVPTSPARPLP